MTNDLIQEVKLFNAKMDTPFGEMKSNFLHGNCYWYAHILYERFQPFYNCRIMYNQIQNHFAVSIQNMLFDAGGIVPSGEAWIEWSYYVAIEPLDAARVYRDCIWHMSEEEWETLPKSYKESPWSFSPSECSFKLYTSS